MNENQAKANALKVTQEELQGVSAKLKSMQFNLKSGAQNTLTPEQMHKYALDLLDICQRLDGSSPQD